MKKLTVLILIVAAALIMTACPMQGTPSSPESNVDANAPAQIVLDETRVEKGNCYDGDGSHIGYYRITHGTNCGNEGAMRIEFLDLNDEVLNTYEPTYAGSTLNYGQLGGTTHGQYEITDIWESDYKDEQTSSKTYRLMKYSGGVCYAYIENKLGATAYCELYNTDGGKVASLTPKDPTHRLEVERIGEEGYLYVTESYTDNSYGEPWSIAARLALHEADGTALGEIAYTYEQDTQNNKPVLVRAEATNAAGEVKRVYERSASDLTLSVNYTNGKVQAEEFGYAAMSVMETLRELYDPKTDMIMFREEAVYENGVRVSKTYIAFGGEMKVTADENGNYKKLEFYNEAGDLMQTVQAAGSNHLTFRYDSEYDQVAVESYDVNGVNVGYYAYKPMN